MSRRSLRLDEGLLDRSLPHSSTSFSVGGTSWRSNRSLKSRRSQQLSVSCSESLLLHTPRKAADPVLLNSSVASDASLLSSLLDESSVQESTMVDTFWGLDHDVDPKESTIIAEESTVLADRTLIGSGARCPKHLVHTLSRVNCKDCNVDRNESVCYSSSKYTATTSSTTCSSTMTRPGRSESETSTIYCRDRSRKSRTVGVLLSVWRAVLSVLALLSHQLHKHQDVTDVLQLWCDWCVRGARSAAAGCVSVLTLIWRRCRRSQTDNRHGARSGPCGVMDLRESTSHQKELHPNGALCDDCQEKQRSETETVTSSSSPSSWSSVASRSLVLMWSSAVFTASCLCQLTCTAAAAVWPLTKKMFSASQSIVRSAGQTAGVVYRWLNRRWLHMTSSSPLTWSPLRLLVLLPLLLLLFSLCWFGPAGLQSVLPAVNITKWRTSISDVPAVSSIAYSFLSSQSQSAEGTVEVSSEVQQYVEEPLYRQPPAAADEEEAVEESEEEAVRLVRLEQSLTALWERVEAGGRRAEERHMEVLRLYTDLQQQQQQLVLDQSGGEAAAPWLSRALEQQLQQIKTQLDEERRHREQSQQQGLLEQQSQTSRLDQLELQLQTLAARTEELQWRREAADTSVSPLPTSLPAAVSGGVDRQSHDALLAEVARLETALEDVRRDVQGLSGCRGSCQQLDTIQHTIAAQVSAQVSAQVREEVRALLYGNQLMAAGGGASGEEAAGLPESLLQWLSQQYVSGDDLQASLAALELSILQNVSLQLEQHRGEEAVREAVLHAAGAAGAAVTEEDVHLIVNNALRLFSEDRTGLADYALESGGGSVLSTRCSETYETKAALLSLFGLPLWYFSQSPRVVIQPDVHPGNCWAFRGSRGFLVIRLSMRVLPTAFSLEHIPKTLAPSGALHSAPRDFSVYGLDDESQESGTLLGTYTYDQDGESLQTYTVTEENNQAFQIIEVQVLSNWGHQEYTCIYRFRVHGTPGDA
ncbi:SUN domain-containing protein 1-like isoform X2 [Centropristis striata]|uniref:SUN domain-containing protein 1-like isoform X2 n=1 Tax=Centropristis striata TaxID=184440 RepID=UPI0027E0FBC3|nr:SUN domain-containing protein 1-like isoform X2 [Centropristis striata]